ncbi:MAG: hypothetical protein KC435_05610 [Thermomicrobiales bacterium]|nr:hypothetical protein [Thermomicrobiales bacterium]
MIPTVFTFSIDAQAQPETRSDVRRMEMFSRAHRDELNAVIVSLTPRIFRKNRVSR